MTERHRSDEPLAIRIASNTRHIDLKTDDVQGTDISMPNHVNAQGVILLRLTASGAAKVFEADANYVERLKEANDDQGKKIEIISANIDELERSKQQIQDDRDHWFQEAENWQKEAERLERERNKANFVYSELQGNFLSLSTKERKQRVSLEELQIQSRIDHEAMQAKINELTKERNNYKQWWEDQQPEIGPLVREYNRYKDLFYALRAKVGDAWTSVEDGM